MKIDVKILDEFTRKLTDNLPDAFKVFREDIEKNFRAVLEGLLQRLDLVTREEFDVQTALLERSRARLDELEQRLELLENNARDLKS